MSLAISLTPLTIGLSITIVALLLDARRERMGREGVPLIFVFGPIVAGIVISIALMLTTGHMYWT